MAAQGHMAAPLRVYSAAADVKLATIRAFVAGRAVIHDPAYATADYSGRCERPIVIDRIGVGHELLSRPIHGAEAAPVGFEREKPFTLSNLVRCRRCEACLKERRWMWTERAAKEWREATRTWLCTFTLRPSEHYKLGVQTRQRLEAQGEDIDKMDARRRLEEMMVEYRDVMRRYVNRLRKGLVQRGWPQVQFRYLWVPEPHKSGLIHFHMLLHEVADDMRIPKRRIEDMWGLGHAGAKEVHSEAEAKYACKYLGKHHFEGRLAVSKHYGEREEDDVAKLAERHFPGEAGGKPVLPFGEDQTQSLRELVSHIEEARGDDTDADPATQDPSDVLPCPTGLHFGARCNCKPPNPEADPWGIEAVAPLTSRGVPERPHRLRGWDIPDHLRKRRRSKPEGVH